ncbi:nucleotide exchange factor GrpE [Actinokineospora iranica]|uniref:Molecular chaperone GrpE (Heat shock protein) n=1 Tax=Actinokineospora iranica TaxID=1271860 RepID=A0A1G6QAQ4_9PSEU|nr:nucleotide exchange factor GrpE [Actinokineospora iranica]SDC89388.1 Molecular chaperone GrpE (heat shock protein) [Actinokineospora iranica]
MDGSIDVAPPDAAAEKVSAPDSTTGDSANSQAEDKPDNSASEQAADKADDKADDLAAALAEAARAYHLRAEARERVIDNLHAEVERLRVGERNLLLRPVIVDLQKLRDDLARQAAGLPEQVTRAQMADLLDSFALSVEQALERCGTVPVRPEVGDSFSARAHRAVKVVAAASAEEDGTVAAVVADGYLDTRTDRVTTPARVHVRRWTPPAEPESTDV